MRIFSLFFLFLSLALSGPLAAQTKGQTIADPTVRVGIIKIDKKRLLQIKAEIVINAERERVWAVMTDCARASSYVPGLKKCEVLEQSPDKAWDIRRHTSKASGPFKGAKSEFKSAYQYPERITVKRTGGDYETLNAVWSLVPLEGGRTQLRYDCQMSAKTIAPSSLVKSFVKKRMKKTLKALKIEVETKG